MVESGLDASMRLYWISALSAILFICLIDVEQNKQSSARCYSRSLRTMKQVLRIYSESFNCMLFFFLNKNLYTAHFKIILKKVMFLSQPRYDKVTL